MTATPKFYIPRNYSPAYIPLPLIAVMPFATIMNSHSLPQHRRNFSLNSITNSIMPPSSTAPNQPAHAKPLFDIESFAFISIFKALQSQNTISHQDMLTIKHDIRTRLRITTGSNKNSKQGDMRVFPKRSATLPLVLPLTREIIRKVVVPVDTGRETRWALRPEFEDVQIHGLGDAELLIQIRAILSRSSIPSAPISRTEASRIAEFVALALPEDFALSRRQILQVLTLASGLDGSATEGKYRLQELKKGLEFVGQDEVVRLLRAAEGDGRALELLKVRIGDGRRV
jgi:hypothetical protein